MPVMSENGMLMLITLDHICIVVFRTTITTFVCSIFLRALSSSFCINAIRFLYDDDDEDN